MPSFEDLIKEKNRRLEEIPLDLQTVVQKQQKKVIGEVLSQLDKLEKVNGQIKINAKNLRAIADISDELKGVFLSRDYIEAVGEFAKEFEVQAGINDRIIKKGFGEAADSVASKEYIDLAKKGAIEALTGGAAEANFIKPVQSILENAVVNGATINDTIDSIRTFVEGDPESDSRILKYVKQVTNDSFAVSDRSYTSIVSESLDNDWFYFAGSEVKNTRCFCEQRVGKYFHYKEIESWGKGENLGECNIGGGVWAGEMPGTNESTIYSYLGGYNCLHSLMPVSAAAVPDSDIQRARDLGFID